MSPGYVQLICMNISLFLDNVDWKNYAMFWSEKFKLDRSMIKRILTIHV